MKSDEIVNSWMPYQQAISANRTSYPEIGEEVLYKTKEGKQKIFFKGVIEKIINSRKYIVRYKIPENIRHFFSNDTTSAIVGINQLLFYCQTIEVKEE